MVGGWNLFWGKLRQNTEGRWDKHMDTTGKKMQNNNITEVKEQQWSYMKTKNSENWKTSNSKTAKDRKQNSNTSIILNSSKVKARQNPASCIDMQRSWKDGGEFQRKVCVILWIPWHRLPPPAGPPPCCRCGRERSYESTRIKSCYDFNPTLLWLRFRLESEASLNFLLQR